MATRRKKIIADGFLRYSERLLAKKFDGVGLHLSSQDAFAELQSAQKAIVFGTHSSWWDVMIAAFTAHKTGLDLFAPMDEVQLKKYWILEYVGLFPASSEKALSYVRNLKEIFSRKERSVLFITPQAEFVCNRLNQPEFKRGLQSTIEMFPDITVFSMSVEYEFWNESRPVILISLEKVVPELSPNMLEALRNNLTQQTHRLLSFASKRNPKDWQWLLQPKAKTVFIQDAANQIRSRVKGDEQSSGHLR